MKRRKFVKEGSTLASLVVASVIPMNLNARSVGSLKPHLHHYVLFWLKPGLSEEKVKGFTGFFDELRKIKTVQTLTYGRAATTEQRDVIDNSFTYALSITFADLEAQNEYQKDPIHLKAIEKYSGNWEKVVVHDAMMS